MIIWPVACTGSSSRRCTIPKCCCSVIRITSKNVYFLVCSGEEKYVRSLTRRPSNNGESIERESDYWEERRRKIAYFTQLWLINCLIKNICTRIVLESRLLSHLRLLCIIEMSLTTNCQNPWLVHWIIKESLKRFMQHTICWRNRNCERNHRITSPFLRSNKPQFEIYY